MKKWEYRRITWSEESGDLLEFLNEYGEKGWEVCHMEHPHRRSSEYSCRQEIYQEVIFKRPLEENP